MASTVISRKLSILRIWREEFSGASIRLPRESIFGAAARMKVKAEFDIEAVADRYQALYRTILSPPEEGGVPAIRN